MREETCRHFNGIMNETCEKGTSYEALTDNHNLGLPCISSGRTSGKEVSKCDKFETLTKEEREAEEKETNERFSYSMAALTLCVEDSDAKGFKKKGPDVAGEIECPKCGKRLAYERAGRNGHIRAACETPECMRWIN